jgi:hypothetical protein
MDTPPRPDIIPLADAATEVERKAKFYAALFLELAPFILSLVLTMGFFGVLFKVLSYGVPDNGGEALLVMLGSLGTAWSGAMGYWFYTSFSSKRKTDAAATKETAQ